MSRKTILAICLVLGSFILLMGVLFFNRGAIKSEVNTFRAERLYSQAQSAFANQNWADAARKATAAYYLNREDGKIPLLVARSMLKQRSINALPWWKLVLDRPDLPVEDLRELTRILIKTRLYEEAMPFLERLVELDSNTDETQVLWLETLSAQRQMSQARALTKALVESGSENWRIHEQYLRMQGVDGDDRGGEGVETHLLGLIEEDGPLALMAARELIESGEASDAGRIRAGDYLLEASDDPVDKLMVDGLRIELGELDRAAIPGILETFLSSDSEDRYLKALDWAFWVKALGPYLEQVDWETYLNSGASAEFYINALLQEGRNEEVLRIAQDRSTMDPAEAANFLVYRIMALSAAGLSEEAETSLQHAVEVTSSEHSRLLESYLLREQKWDLLVKLYDSMIENNPNDAGIKMRQIAGFYFTGQQDLLEDSLEGVNIEMFEEDIWATTFVVYLKLILEGPTPQLHSRIEGYLTRYPDFFDFRLIVGLSYVLQGRNELGYDFADGMPEITLRAPRHLRVCTAILKQSLEGLFTLGELDSLTPRERFLLSQIRD